MSRSQSLTPFALSLALHAGVLLLVLVGVSRDEPLPALIIDLRDPVVPGAASVATAPREERPAPSSAAPQSSRSRSTVAEKTAPATPEPTPPAPSAPAAPAPSSAPVIEAAPPPPSAAEAPRESMPAAPPAAPAAPSSREVIEARPSGPPAAVTTAEPNSRLGGGSTVASPGSGSAAAVDRGTPAAASDRGATGRGEPGGPLAARVAVAPSSGAGGGAGAEYGPYLTALRERIQQSVRYPASARRRGLAGTVGVEILILANGTIGDVTLLESSSHALLDDAALDTIRALPRMPLPPELPARPLRVRVPVVFQLR